MFTVLQTEVQSSRLCFELSFPGCLLVLDSLGTADLCSWKLHQGNMTGAKHCHKALGTRLTLCPGF